MKTITLSAIFHSVLFLLVLSSMVFRAEGQESSIKLRETVKLAETDQQKYRAWLYLAGSIDSHMTSWDTRTRFIHRDMSLWILFRTPIKEDFVLQKYFPLLKTYDEFPPPEGAFADWMNQEKRQEDDRKRRSRPHVASFNYHNLIISPNEKYVLQRDSLESHTFSEVKTGRLITGDVPPGEIVLGFDDDSNIYCGRLTSPPEFVVRNPETMQIVKTFRTPDNDVIEKTNNTDEQDMFYTICPVPVESSDRKHVVIQFYQHRPPGATAEIYRDDPRLLKEWVEAEENNPRRCSIGAFHVYDQETGNLAYEAPFGIGVVNAPMGRIPVVSEDGRKIIYPDYAAKGVWVYDFETRTSRSLLIPQPSISRSPMENSWKSSTLKGFTFTPENQILVWLCNWSDKEWPVFPGIYRFDPEDGSYQIMTDFVSEKEFIPEDEKVEASDARVTWQFFYSPDHRTVITFQKPPGWFFAPEHIGKYVFWDYHTKEKLFETEEKYIGNMILTPDWKTAILTTTRYTDFEAENQYGQRTPQSGHHNLEIYDITGITERSDVLHEPQNR